MTTNAILFLWSDMLWRATWQGGLAVAIAWLICRLFPSIPPRFQAWLWRLALLKFAVVLVLSTPLEIPLLPPVTYSAMNVAVEVHSSTTVAAEAPAAAVTHFQKWPLGILFAAWLLVAAWQVVRVVRSLGLARRLRNQCQPLVDVYLQRLVQHCSQDLRAPLPRLLEHAGAGSPLLVGLWRPAIVFPRETLAQLQSDERELVVRHELAHAVRRDLAWSLLAAVVRGLLFFHPLAWLLEQRLNFTQELAADELALGSRRQEPLQYAAQLLTIIGKLGSAQPAPLLTASVAGTSHSLQQRVLAMQRFYPVSRREVGFFVVLLSAAAAIGIVPWQLVAADAPTGPVKAMTSGGHGKFVSYKEGALLLRANSGETLSWQALPKELKAVRYSAEQKGFQPAGGLEALADVKPGTWIQVRIEKNTTHIRIGERQGATTGTFVSYKDHRLLMLGTSLGESFVKKYGNTIHFNRFAAGVPVFESIDGGAYQPIGAAEEVLAKVKEGTVLTVHAEGDDNITMIQIGKPKAN